MRSAVTAGKRKKEVKRSSCTDLSTEDVDAFLIFGGRALADAPKPTATELFAITHRWTETISTAGTLFFLLGRAVIGDPIDDARFIIGDQQGAV